MTVKTVVAGSRSEASVRLEIKSLQELIQRRQAWLDKPANRMKGTYQAVLDDTRHMISTLRKLRAELEQITMLAGTKIN